MHDVSFSESMGDGELDVLGPTSDYVGLAGCRESGQDGRDGGIGISVVNLSEGLKDVRKVICRKSEEAEVRDKANISPHTQAITTRIVGSGLSTPA